MGADRNAGGVAERTGVDWSAGRGQGPTGEREPGRVVGGGAAPDGTVVRPGPERRATNGRVAPAGE